MSDLHGNIFLILILYYSAVVLVAIFGNQFKDFLPFLSYPDNLDKKNIAKHLFLNLLVYLIGLIIIHVIVILLFFYYFVITQDKDLAESFQYTLGVISDIVWRGGKMSFVHANIWVSILTLTFVMLIYAMKRNEYLKNLKFPSKIAENENKSITFQKYHLMFGLLIGMYLISFTFLSYWEVSRIECVKYMVLMMLIALFYIFSFENKNIIGVVFVLLFVGYIMSIGFKFAVNQKNLLSNI